MRLKWKVRDLICLLTLNNPEAVDCLNQKLMDSIDSVLKRSRSSLVLLNSVRHEMALLAASLQCQDACWEKRLRSIVQLFLKSTRHLESPAVMDVITLPCLSVIQDLIQGLHPLRSVCFLLDFTSLHWFGSFQIVSMISFGVDLARCSVVELFDVNWIFFQERMWLLSPVSKSRKTATSMSWWIWNDGSKVFSSQQLNLISIAHSLDCSIPNRLLWQIDFMERSKNHFELSCDSARLIDVSTVFV